MKYHITTYGCQMNHSDSERIATILEKQGYQKTPEPEGADLVLINMCSVRQKPVDKAVNKIKNLKLKIKNCNLKLKIIATGCFLEKDKQELKKLDVEIKKFKDLVKIKPKTGFVPIMRGCNNFCSYCVVPYTRGREKYRSQEEIICEVKHLVGKGIQEITLLGQNVNSYKCKTTNQNAKFIDFADLLKEMNKLPGDFKIRFLTNHPKDMSDELIKTIAQCDKVVKHIHLPFQAGSNKILKKMNRRYTKQQYLRLIQKITKTIPSVELTTDVIVGFPGETKKDFAQTIEVIKKANFKQAFIAKYSSRPGTAAFKLKDNVPLAEKKRREQILRKLINRADSFCPIG